MTKLTLEQQELLFANDCKLINLRYEYHGYTGTEKWAIVTELAEEELWVKYPDVIRRYTPFILLSMAQGEVITEYQNYEAMSTYRSKKGLMYNYIIPLIGDVKLDELTPRLMDTGQRFTRCGVSQFSSRKYNLQAEMERRRYEIGSGRLRTRPNGYGCRCLQPYH